MGATLARLASTWTGLNEALAGPDLALKPAQPDQLANFGQLNHRARTDSRRSTDRYSSLPSGFVKLLVRRAPAKRTIERPKMMRLYPSRYYRRLWLKFFHLLVAGTVGWLLSAQWLNAQDWVGGLPDRLSAAPVRGRGSLCDPTLVPGTSHDGLAGQFFWQSPRVGQTHAATTFHITKVPFRYGDFGATSYPQRYQATNYYRSRTDWVWE